MKVGGRRRLGGAERFRRWLGGRAYIVGGAHLFGAPHLAGFCDPPTRSIYSVAETLGVAQGPHLRLVIG